MNYSDSVDVPAHTQSSREIKRDHPPTHMKFYRHSVWPPADKQHSSVHMNQTDGLILKKYSKALHLKALRLSIFHHSMTDFLCSTVWMGAVVKQESESKL